MTKVTSLRKAVCVFWAGLALGWTISPSVLAEETAPFPNFSAEYVLKRNGVSLGNATRSLRTAGEGRYIFESVTYATGMIAWFVKDRIEERSIWTFHEGQVRPLEYVYNRHGGKKARRVKLLFDWGRGVVTNNIDGDPWRMDIPAGTQDKLLHQLAIMQDLKKGRTDLQYNVADGGRLKNYRFEVLGEEMMNTPLGKFKTVKIERLDDKRDTIVWCAPALNYLPVRLEQQETDGSRLSMDIQSVKGLPAR